MDPVEMFARRNCASILQASEAAKSNDVEKPSTAGRNCFPPLDLMSFKCKDCNRLFPSFQALGGHRASHLKLRLNNQEAVAAGSDRGEVEGFPVVNRPGRFKIHECRECRIRFASGQALGGHMRKHAEFSAKRKRDEVEVENILETGDDLDESKKKVRLVENFLDTFDDLDDSKKKIRKVVELDLNCSPPPEDEPPLQLELVL